MSNFWGKVEKCEHENISPHYYCSVYCDTPYCSGDEVHCLDCGVYITQCDCHHNNGISGWSHSRWRTYWKQREKKRKEAREKSKQDIMVT